MIDIVMKAREMGVFVIVADKEPTSPAKRFADKKIDISTNDIEELCKFCKEENVNGIFTGFEDFNIHIARTLCERLDLPFYATKEQLDIVTNKHIFKEKCRQYGVPVIEQYSLEQAKTNKKFPYIIKPTDSYGSRGISVCNTVTELETGYKRALSSSKSKTAIIERFIDSDYGTELFYTIVNGKIYLSATADRYTVSFDSAEVPLPVAEVFPSKHTDDMILKLDGKIRNMLSGLDIENGLVLIQALYDKGEYFIYEMAYRFTGEQHYRLIEKQHGIDLAKMMIKHALGEDISEYKTDLISHESFNKPSVNLAVILKPGSIKSIRGLEKVYKIDEVTSYNLTHFDGDTIRPSGDYSHMLIRVNMVAENIMALKNAILQVKEYISVTSEEGEEMIVSPFVLED